MRGGPKSFRSCALVDRQHDSDARTAFCPVAQKGMPPVLFDDFLGDGEPEPCPSWFARGVGLESVFKHDRTEARSIVFNEEFGIALHEIVTDAEQDLPVRLGVKCFKSVAQEIVENLANPLFVGFDQWRRLGKIGDDLDARVAASVEIRDFGGESAQIEAGEPEIGSTCVITESPNHVLQGFDLPDDGLDGVL
jgi:hypothetical protein